MNIKNYTYFHGRRIVEDISMTVPGDPIKEKRTWKERLFTWPWKPFKAYNTTIPQVPSGEVIIVDDYFIMHPFIADAFKKSIENEG